MLLEYAVVGIKNESALVRIIKQKYVGQIFFFDGKNYFPCFGLGSIFLESVSFPEYQLNSSTVFVQGWNKEKNDTVISIPLRIFKDFKETIALYNNKDARSVTD